MLLIQDEKYAHLSEDDMKAVSGHVETKQQWMHARMADFAKMNKFDNPPYLTSAISAERTVSEGLARARVVSVMFAPNHALKYFEVHISTWHLQG